MSAPLVLALILAVAIPVQLVRVYRPDAAFTERWMRERGLDPAGRSRETVARYLRQVRILRTWGGVAGALVPTLVELVWHGRVTVLGFGTDGESAPLAFGAIYAGYLVAGLYAEITLVRPVAGGPGAARLPPRNSEAYLPRRLVVAQRALAAAAALGVVAIGLVPYPAS